MCMTCMQQMQFTTQIAVVNFCLKKQIPIAQFITKYSKSPKLGCLQGDKSEEAFLEIVRYLEDNDDEQITNKDLIDLMKHIL